jgi:hypothetical protein
VLHSEILSACLAAMSSSERLLERIDDETKNWKFSAAIWTSASCGTIYSDAYADALSKCSTKWAPWYLVPSDKNKARNYLIAKTDCPGDSGGLESEYPKPKTDLEQYRASLKARREELRRGGPWQFGPTSNRPVDQFTEKTNNEKQDTETPLTEWVWPLATPD